MGKGVGPRVSYDGSHGSNLGAAQNLNEVPANTIGFDKANVGAPYPIWAFIAFQVSRAESNYHAMTTTLKKRFSGGLQFQGTYTYTRNLSNQGGYAPTAFPGESGGYFTDQYHPGLDYGNFAFSRRQRLLLPYLSELPSANAHRFAT